jgi:hypothetical protein
MAAAEEEAEEVPDVVREHESPGQVELIHGLTVASDFPDEKREVRIQCYFLDGR